MRREYLHSPIHLHGVVLNYAQGHIYVENLKLWNMQVTNKFRIFYLWIVISKYEGHL